MLPLLSDGQSLDSSATVCEHAIAQRLGIALLELVFFLSKENVWCNGICKSPRPAQATFQLDCISADDLIASRFCFTDSKAAISSAKALLAAKGRRCACFAAWRARFVQSMAAWNSPSLM